ncbi:MAG: matrixin family metalloprotease, partial [Bryobacteraceae bacterium]|nr:matrixin family metalloprotease [Bryobacteraceae bacterium]
GGYLAHAFYPAPWNKDPIAGDLHFDDDETWSSGGNPDMYSVMLHEIGHALGLQHAQRPGTVMYPYYRSLMSLHPEDIDALRQLYPARNPSSAPVPVEPEPVTPESPAPELPSPEPVPESPAPQPTVPTLQPEAPETLVVSLSTPASTLEASVDISGSIHGGYGPFLITWAAGSGPGGTAEGELQWVARGIPLTIGSNAITITASDSRGARAVRTINVSRKTIGNGPDTVMPSLNVTSPSTTVYATSAAQIKVSGNARDNVGVSQVTWRSASGEGVAEGTSSWTFTLPLQVGDNQLIVRATDEAGNAGWRSLMITRR